MNEALVVVIVGAAAAWLWRKWRRPAQCGQCAGAQAPAANGVPDRPQHALKAIDQLALATAASNSERAAASACAVEPPARHTSSAACNARAKAGPGA